MIKTKTKILQEKCPSQNKTSQIDEAKLGGVA